MRIAIIGASGQFGRCATALLLEGNIRPDQLILTTRRPEALADRAAQGLVVRRGDFDEHAALVDAFAGADRLLLISGTRVGYREEQHANAIAAARDVGIRRIVYTSFVGAEADNPSLAVRDHVATERILRKSGMAWTIMRNAQYAEAVRDVMAPLVMTSGRMVSAAGDGRMAFVARGDCVAAAVAALTGDGHDGRTYNITGPDLLRYDQVAALIAEITGTPVAFEPTDEAGMYALFDALGVPREPVDAPGDAAIPWNSDDMVSFELAVRAGHFAVRDDGFERLTGRRPRALRDLLHAGRDALLAAGQR